MVPLVIRAFFHIALKRLSQKENRWISDVNHCLSKTLVDTYGQNSCSFWKIYLELLLKKLILTRIKLENYIHGLFIFDERCEENLSADSKRFGKTKDKK